MQLKEQAVVILLGASTQLPSYLPTYLPTSVLPTLLGANLNNPMDTVRGVCWKARGRGSRSLEEWTTILLDEFLALLVLVLLVLFLLVLVRLLIADVSGLRQPFKADTQASIQASMMLPPDASITLTSHVICQTFSPLIIHRDSVSMASLSRIDRSKQRTISVCDTYSVKNKFVHKLTFLSPNDETVKCTYASSGFSGWRDISGELQNSFHWLVRIRRNYLTGHHRNDQR